MEWTIQFSGSLNFAIYDQIWKSTICVTVLDISKLIPISLYFQCYLKGLRICKSYNDSSSIQVRFKRCKISIRHFYFGETPYTYSLSILNRSGLSKCYFEVSLWCILYNNTINQKWGFISSNPRTVYLLPLLRVIGCWGPRFHLRNADPTSTNLEH